MNDSTRHHEVRPIPGETMMLSFPALPDDLSGQPAQCGVRVPESFDAARPLPLLLWLGGWNGTNSPDDALDLVDAGVFAIAALPYPSTAPVPLHAMQCGMIPVIWNYHHTMLAELRRVLPNIEPALSVAAGFSNGAHAIGSYLAHGLAFASMFRAFVLIEGGAVIARPKWARLEGKNAYLAWGENSLGGSGAFMELTVACGQKAGLRVTTHEMQGVGHAFPHGEKDAVRRWICETITNAPPASLSSHSRTPGL